jgi:hypothetical protein
MRTSAFRTVLTGMAGLLFGFSAIAPAQAEATGLETASLLGGRIVGAAKACGINAERIRRTSERMLHVVNNKAGSEIERTTATNYFVVGQETGTEQVREDRTRCSAIHVDFSEIEVKLGRAPAVEKASVVLKQGVPALGALTK